MKSKKNDESEEDYDLNKSRLDTSILGMQTRPEKPKLSTGFQKTLSFVPRPKKKRKPYKSKYSVQSYGALAPRLPVKFNDVNWSGVKKEKIHERVKDESVDNNVEEKRKKNLELYKAKKELEAVANVFKNKFKSRRSLAVPSNSVNNLADLFSGLKKKKAEEEKKKPAMDLFGRMKGIVKAGNKRRASTMLNVGNSLMGLISMRNVSMKKDSVIEEDEESGSEDEIKRGRNFDTVSHM